VTHDGVAGTIIVIDEDADGTVIVLECAESDGDAVVIPSDDPEDEYVYDLGRRGADVAAARLKSPEPFVVGLNTTDMPRGPLTFELERFIEEARRSAHLEQPIRLNEKIAEQFGYRAHASA